MFLLSVLDCKTKTTYIQRMGLSTLSYFGPLHYSVTATGQPWLASASISTGLQSESFSMSRTPNNWGLSTHNCCGRKCCISKKIVLGFSCLYPGNPELLLKKWTIIQYLSGKKSDKNHWSPSRAWSELPMIMFLTHFVHKIWNTCMQPPS